MDIQSLSNVFSAVNQSSIISKTDKTGTITFVNSNFERISGYNEIELIGQPHSIVNSGFHPTMFWTQVWRTICQGNIWRGEVCNRAKSGKFYWVDTFIYPFFDVDGRLVEYFSIRNDITERKLQEEAVTKTANLLRTILNSTSDIFILLDKNKTLLSANANAENLLAGAESPDVAVINFLNLQYNLNEYFERALGGDRVEEESLLNHFDGSSRWYKISFHPAYKRRGEMLGVSISLKDIDTRKQQEIALQKQNQALSEIAWLQSHEIRRPVASILGLVELLVLEQREQENTDIINHLKRMTQELDQKTRRIVRISNESEVNLFSHNK